MHNLFKRTDGTNEKESDNYKRATFYLQFRCFLPVKEREKKKSRIINSRTLLKFINVSRTLFFFLNNTLFVSTI